jgi:hypothetical protein
MTDGDDVSGRWPAPSGWESAEDVAVTAHRSSPETTVFTEEGNTDGWIASDTTVDPEP